MGIDPGLNHLGFAIVESLNDFTEIGVISPPEKDEMGARLLYLKNSIAKLLNNYNIKGICAEAPSYGSTTRAYSLGAVHGLIHLEAYVRNIPLIKAAPTQLKKFITGRGHSSKEKVRRVLAERYTWEPSTITSLDASDAAALALIALHFFGETRASKRCELEVLKKLRESAKV